MKSKLFRDKGYVKNGDMLINRPEHSLVEHLLHVQEGAEVMLGNSSEQGATVASMQGNGKRQAHADDGTLSSMCTTQHRNEWNTISGG
jgi:hypothetical protein